MTVYDIYWIANSADYLILNKKKVEQRFSVIARTRLQI